MFQEDHRNANEDEDYEDDGADAKRIKQLRGDNPVRVTSETISERTRTTYRLSKWNYNSSILPRSYLICLHGDICVSDYRCLLYENYAPLVACLRFVGN